MAKLCAMSDCEKPARSLGWCVRHYKRYLRNGDPAGKHRPKLPWPERFWSQVEKTETCWLWTGALDDDGYGFLNGPDSRKTGVHRLAVTMDGRDIPQGHVIRHTCDVRHCVNPAHLLTGTPADNVADTISRGRARVLVGEQCGTAKLTDRQVSEIRALHAAGALQRELAARYGVSQPTISGIVNRKSRNAPASHEDVARFAEVHHVTIRVVPFDKLVIGEDIDGRAPLEVIEHRPGQPTITHGTERGIPLGRLTDHARSVAETLGVPFIDPIDPAVTERLMAAEVAW